MPRKWKQRNRGNEPLFPVNVEAMMRDPQAPPISADALRGVTLREAAAMVAMQGIVAGLASDPTSILDGPQIAGTAVQMADELVRALESSK